MAGELDDPLLMSGLPGGPMPQQAEDSSMGMNLGGNLPDETGMSEMSLGKLD